MQCSSTYHSESRGCFQYPGDTLLRPRRTESVETARFYEPGRLRPAGVIGYRDRQGADFTCLALRLGLEHFTKLCGSHRPWRTLDPSKRAGRHGGQPLRYCVNCFRLPARKAENCAVGRRMPR